MMPSVSLVAVLLWVGSLDAPLSHSRFLVTAPANELYLQEPEQGVVEQEDVVVHEEGIEEKSVLYDVPFTSQSPTGEWEDIRQQNACEEASVLMAMAWVQGEQLPDTEKVKERLLEIDAYENEQYGAHLDTSASDVIDYIFNGYYAYENVSLKKVESVDNIITSLQEGLVIIPADGRALYNPHFTDGGPERHMLVVIGYDNDTNEFITNDPGTKFGKDFRYTSDVLFNAIRDYETGYHVPIVEQRKVMIVVGNW
ncbi:MAG: C39 family peptidase [Patescibacteria group bacterium]